MPLRAVLLDIDGTLLDSNDAHARAWVEAARELGFDVSYARVRPLIGMGGDKLIPMLFGADKDSELGQRLSRRRREIFDAKYLPTLRPTRGARELVRRLRDDGLILVVATSAEREEMRRLLRAAGIDDLIDDATSSSDAGSSKPDPDIVHAALERAGQPPEAALMLGDTPYDVEAATKAGVGTIALRCGGWDDAALRGAIAIYDDPADLLAHYESSPLGASRARVA